MRDYKEKDNLEDRKSLKGVPDLRRDNSELKRKQSPKVCANTKPEFGKE